jgi:DNA-binding transcriptional LysR family regulator
MSDHGGLLSRPLSRSEAAATFLGAHQSALVHQFRRLERDIGARLY